MSTDSKVLWKGPPLCRCVAWHLFCSLATHSGLCWESSECISSLAQGHGILTCSCRQGCLMKRFRGEKKEATRRRYDKCGTVICRVKWYARRKARKCPLHIALYCRAILTLNMFEMSPLFFFFFVSRLAALQTSFPQFYVTATYGRNLVQLCWKLCWNFFIFQDVSASKMVLCCRFWKMHRTYYAQKLDAQKRVQLVLRICYAFEFAPVLWIFMIY